MRLRLSAKPEDLRSQFYALQTRADVAQLLEVDESQLNYYLYPRPRKTIPDKYVAFSILKKNGGQRIILAPNAGLKIVQQKLNQVLQAVYEPKPTVQGFVPGRNIVSNARLHEKAKYVLNVDLQDFFPSINFGRVRGMFASQPYNLNLVVATILAQICCHENQLPQGAPTSPIISNMICAIMDNQLQYLAKKHKCTYTRYADDLTFSTSTRNFPRPVAYITTDIAGEHTETGHDLIDVITANGFALNVEKARLQPNTRHQEVTGLTTNQRANVPRKHVRQIRAMFHAWEKFGLAAAEREFARRYAIKHPSPHKRRPTFRDTLWGKIAFLGMVRGKDSRAYLAFRAEFLSRNPASEAQQRKVRDTLLFVSHSSKDDAFVDRLMLDLKISGFQTWVDHHDVSATQAWDHDIHAALDRCQKLVFVVSEHSVQSEECHFEWNHVLKKKPIVIALLNPGIEKHLNYRLDLVFRIDLFTDYAHGLAMLLKKLSD